MVVVITYSAQRLDHHVPTRKVSCCAELQVSRQLASKCAELTRCQSELQQVQHMLAAAYAANAALQVRFTQASRLP